MTTTALIPFQRQGEQAVSDLTAIIATLERAEVLYLEIVNPSLAVKRLHDRVVISLTTLRHIRTGLRNALPSAPGGNP